MDAVHQVRIVIRCRPVAAQTQPHAMRGHCGDIRHLGPDQIDGFGAMRHAGARGRELAQFGIGQFPAMGIEGVRPGKADLFQIIHRPHPMARGDERAFSLADMGVQEHALVAGEGDRLLKRFAVAVHRLAGRDHHLAHAERCRVVVAVDQARAISDEFIRRFQHLVGIVDPSDFGKVLPPRPA